MSAKSEELLRDTKFSWLFGKTSIYLMIGIYIVFWFLFSMYPDSKYFYTWVDYFVGCFLIGPLNTMFAYFYANFL